MKNCDSFLISAQNIDCGYSLEPPRWGGSNEYPQSMFWAEIRKIMYTPVNPSFTIKKWGLRGSKLYRRVFVMKRRRDEEQTMAKQKSHIYLPMHKTRKDCNRGTQQNQSGLFYGINFITKARLFKYIDNFTTKNWKFSDKTFDIFHISAENINCGYSLEPPRRGVSNEYRQSMFLSRNKKNKVYHCKPQFYCIKVGFKGSKWYRRVFVMCPSMSSVIFSLRTT